MWSFSVEAILRMVFFYRLFKYVLQLEIQLSRGEGCDAINQFNPTTFCVCLKTGPGFLTSYKKMYVMVLFSVQRFEVRDDCSFCFYWWNC